MPEWVDRVLGSDPGLNRLRTALQAVVTIGLAMMAERLFVTLTHALQVDTHGADLSPAQAAVVAAQHHGVLVIAIILGAIIGLLSAFSGGIFPTTRKQVEGFLLMPVFMVAGLALGLSLAPHRSISQAMLVVVLAGGAYCRRFGPLGFIGGSVFFMGDFFGFFLNGGVHLRDLGWLTAEICLGTAVALLAQFTLFYPGRQAALRRMRRSYGTRAREVAAAAIDVLDATPQDERASQRLHRRLVRLNEAALMIDAQLSIPTAVPGHWSAGAMHQSLFDAELALTNMARFAERIRRLGLSAPVLAHVREALASVGDSELLRAELSAHALLDGLRADAEHVDPDGERDRTAQIVVHRFAISALGFVEAVHAWRRATPTTSQARAEADDVPFQSPVVLMAGWLPGSAMVSAAASAAVGPGASAPGRRWFGARAWDRARLAPNERVAIQMAVAVSVAIVLGDLLSERRFYWAVIAAFITFMGTNNTREQVTKGTARVIGTIIGALAGVTLAHLVGDRTDLAIVVILVSLFFGLYLMRVNYAFMVIGITVMVSQLYVQLDEFTNHLLVLRLEETALGAGVAVLTVLCVLPLRTGRVLLVASCQYLESLGAVVAASVDGLLQPGTPLELRAATRALDSAFQTLVTTASSMRLPLGARDDALETFLVTASAARHYARNLMVDTTTIPSAGPDVRRGLEEARERFAASLTELTTALQDGRAERAGRTYLRTASLFDQAAAGAGGGYAEPHQLALRDLQLIDGALAALAEQSGLSVDALDAAGSVAARSAAGGASQPVS